MSELDAEWERRVAEAAGRARETGRGDVAEYLLLRAANDEARAFGVAWLIDTFHALAGEANRAGASVTASTDDAHRFRAGHSTMVGRRLTLRAGVRSMTVEAGWPRAPGDGIVRGNGLAFARLSHFGDGESGEELLLVRAGDDAPQWVSHAEGRSLSRFLESRARFHVSQLLR
ncbi:MAG: hypothetical protein LC800_22685 [Acidobacteria bacterium]|nr:hypothetical protein [Acidobacteriota bacterium]